MKRTCRLVLVAFLGWFASAAPVFAQKKIYIDPGHGGADFGAVNPSRGTREAARVLFTGLELRRLMEKDTADTSGGGAWSVRMSRSTDVFISLGARSSDANAWGADRFLSIHQNAYNQTANGTETFALSDSGSAAELRNLVQAEAIKAWGRVNRGNKTAGYSVLRNSAMPAVLTEMGFIDSSVDHPFCASDEKCRDYAKHLLFAFQKHYGGTPFLPAGAAPDTIVDNLASTGYSETGEWETSPYKGFWDKDSRWANAFEQLPPNTATFTPTLTEAGKYQVDAWWMPGTNRSPSAGFVVTHNGGTTVVRKDQRSGGNTWNSLGTFDFAAGTSGMVMLTSAESATGSSSPSATVISSDAVRFTRLGDASTPSPTPTPTPTPPPTPPPAPSPTPGAGQEITVDNSSSGFSAPGRRWFTARQSSGYVAQNYHARRTDATSDPATWSVKLPAAGKWEVFARWPAAENRTSSAPFVVLHKGGSTTRYLNQQKNNNNWVSLGTYEFSAGTSPRVMLSCWTRSGTYVIADAIKLVKK
jgi:N-acetylmuramoyl-L-alanine amidase